ncbi:MFS transporter [Kitasatospora sp. NPDC056651]|uniref:MFS transporter n=1 Tax=Kitasatospora sp. NPDC056651 TaxID=3345892 RepID=UPI00367E4BAD
MVLAGLMTGTLFGLPLSHLLASTLGWRASFFLLAAGAAVMALAVLVCLPKSSARQDRSPSSGELRNGRLWLRYLSSFLTIGGVFAAFAFIDPILRDAGLGSAQGTLTMLGFGGAAFLVNRLGGRVPRGRGRDDAGRPCDHRPGRRPRWHCGGRGRLHRRRPRARRRAGYRGSAPGAGPRRPDGLLAIEAGV